MDDINLRSDNPIRLYYRSKLASGYQEPSFLLSRAKNNSNKNIFIKIPSKHLQRLCVLGAAQHPQLVPTSTFASVVLEHFTCNLFIIIATLTLARNCLPLRKYKAATTHKNSPKTDDMLWLDHTLNSEMESRVSLTAWNPELIKILCSARS